MDGDMKSLVTPQWHLIMHQKLRDQLYDWVHDPGELHNLINTQEGRSIAAILGSEVEAQTKAPR
jgi:hypothetical protein